MSPASIFLTQGRKSISITSKLIRSFSTFDPSGPPEPIPNRRLRDVNTSSTRRPNPAQPFPKPEPPQPNKPLRTPSSDADFLERFKLGFENSPKGEEIGPENNPEAVVEDSQVPAIPEDADEIFRRMKEKGLIPNAVAMLDGLCKDGLVQEAMKLFGVMREKGTIPEVVIYTGVVEGFCMAHKFDDAIRIFRKMGSNGIEANAFSYGVLVRGLCQGNRLEDAVGFCVEMLEAGHSPNLATFVGLVDGVCREKGLEDAKSLIGTLKQRGYFYDEKAAKDYLEKKGPFLPPTWEAIIGKKSSEKFSFFD